jgi:uncharacterized protein
MPFITARILIGLLVGTLVGMTGVGGGIVLLPILISLLGVPPIIAVGSDAVVNFISKSGATYLHWRQGTFNWKVVLALARGSVPGTLAGLIVLAHIRNTYGAAVNDFERIAIGLLLIIVPLLLALKNQLSEGAHFADPHAWPLGSDLGISAIGLFAGFTVGITSIGSGSIILVLLLFFYRYSPPTMVGTDIVHALLLTTITGMFHFGLGTVDLPLIVYLSIGSLPGALLGTYLSKRMPTYWLKRVLCMLLFVSGARMLWI